MKYILDFDRVIFDVQKYRVVRQERGVEQLNFTPAIWDELRVCEFLYQDALDFMQAKGKDSVLIISAATPSFGPEAVAFQERKIRDSGMEDFASKVMVMQGDKGAQISSLGIGEPFWFIDDKLSHLESTCALCPQARCIQLLRPGGLPEGDQVSQNPQIPVVANFEEVNAIIEA